jgi:hypothetical protein
MHQIVDRDSLVRQASAAPAKLELRAVTAFSGPELEEAAAMLAFAFDDSPLMQLAFPRDSVRATVLRAMFAATLEDAARFGQIEIAYNQKKIVGMLIWYRPGRYPMSMLRMLRMLPVGARMVAASPAGFFKLLRAEMTFNRIRPKEPHCHGYFLGGRQGDHVGSVLIKRLFDHADALGMPIYLETQAPRTTKLYARLGFKMRENGIESLPGGPPTWTMWREPRTRDDAIPDGAILKPA